MRATKSRYITTKNASRKSAQWRTALGPTRGRWKKIHLARAALIVIDMQRYFTDPRSHAFLPAAPAILPHVLHVIARFRKARRPVIFTTFAVENGAPDPIRRWWGNSVCVGSRWSVLTPELQPRPGEIVLQKSAYSAFSGTRLASILRRVQADALVITGVLTHLCCESTARDAFDRNLDVFVVIDALATEDEETHLRSLRSLCTGFATPLMSDDL